MTDKFLQRNQSFWRALPPKTLFIVLDHPDEATRAIVRLERAGIAHDQIRLWRGPEDAKAIDPHRATDSWTTRLARLLQKAGDVFSFREQYADWLRRGKTAIAVRVNSSEERERVRRIFERRGGRAVGYTDNWTFTACA